jgi:SLT domain-containing protein
MFNEKTKINNNNKTIENAIWQLKINYHYNAPNLADKNTIDTINAVISEAIAAIDYIVFNYSTRYAMYVASAEPNILNPDNTYSMVLPYFSVDWNGEMFARKGKIANTWVIDDYALTYKKNNDILYLGSEEYVSNNMKTEANSYIPKGRALKAG